MSSRWRIILIAALITAVAIGAIYFPSLKRRVQAFAKIQQPTEEQARRELTPAVGDSESEPAVKATMYWASEDNDGALSPVTVQLPLAKDPVLRAKQVLNSLLAGPVDSETRTLPADAALLAFYILPDGTAIADFSEALANATPSGIQSEQRAVDSITKTLAANVPEVVRLKILIHGQEVDTLAGHLDLTGAFAVSKKALFAYGETIVAPVPGASNVTPVSQIAAPDKLTHAAATSKLSQ